MIIILIVSFVVYAGYQIGKLIGFKRTKSEWDKLDEILHEDNAKMKKHLVEQQQSVYGGELRNMLSNWKHPFPTKDEPSYEEQLEEAVSTENYEEAARLKILIDKKNKKNGK